MADFILYTGPMFSSKTTRLLMEVDTRQYRKQKVITFKSSLDDRYSSVGEIVTHNFNKVPAHIVKSGDDIIRMVAENDDIDCVVVDELFMIPGGSKACIELFKNGYDVVIASIDLTYKGKPFDEIKEIMPYCTEIHKCTAVCPVCGNNARYTFRKNDSNEDVLVGSEDLYEPRCQLHFSPMRE